MSKTIVSILSDQLIPNILFIKQMADEIDHHIFISTEEMESNGKSTILADTLRFKEEKFRVVTIDQHNPVLISEKFGQEKFSETYEYLVNLTGGTKMMSQMTYRHFSKFKNCHIYYWPIGMDYVETIFPKFGRYHFKNQVSLDLKTYFLAYGYSFSKATSISQPFRRSALLLDAVATTGDSGAVPEIFNANHTAYTGDDKNYLLGGWFEEWMFTVIRKGLNLKEEEIGLNLKIKNYKSIRNTESDKEIDVAFVCKNNLYIIECKVFSAKQINGKRITDTIYKISSIRHSLGLKATAMVAILSPFGQSTGRKEMIQDTTSLAQVKKVFSMNDFKNKDNFINGIKAIVNYG